MGRIKKSKLSIRGLMSRLVSCQVLEGRNPLEGNKFAVVYPAVGGYILSRDAIISIPSAPGITGPSKNSQQQATV